MTMDNSQLKALEHKVDDLIRLCEELNHENTTLKNRQEAWRSERAQLLQKNEAAKSKVEGMIARLRALEEDS